MGKTNYKLCVRCFTYNQSSYIEQTLDGFCMQETTFPFVCTIIDDASTDGEQEIIKKYLLEHFDLQDKSTTRNIETSDYILFFARHKLNINCFFAVLFLKYNHYSIKKDKFQYISEWLDVVRYEALCEGDDYWIDSGKLQKQVTFLEENLDYVLCFHNVKVFKQQENELVDDFITIDVPETTTIDFFVQGNYIHTPSIVFRHIPEVIEVRNQLYGVVVGDFVNNILLAQYGKIKKLHECMSVYRYGVGIWTNTQNCEVDKKIQIISDLSKLLVVVREDIKPIVYDIIRMRQAGCIELYNGLYKDLGIVINSLSYRLGNCLVTPIRFFRNLFYK